MIDPIKETLFMQSMIATNAGKRKMLSGARMNVNEKEIANIVEGVVIGIETVGAAKTRWVRCLTKTMLPSA